MISRLEKYNYNLPERLIAQKPVVPRDRSRLLIYKRKNDEIIYDNFLNLTKYLPKKSVLVFNETKVLPARIFLKKETGGRVEILYLKRKNKLVEALADKKLAINSKIFLNSKKGFLVVGQNKNIYYLKPLFSNVENFFQKYGQMPIPPYIKNSPLSRKELKKNIRLFLLKNRIFGSSDCFSPF